MLKLKALQQIILYKYRVLSGYGALVCLAIYFSFWRLSSIAHGFSSSELGVIVSNLSWSGWIKVPTAILTHTAQWSVLKLWGVSLFGLRGTSVIFGLAAMLLLFISIKHWLGRTIAVFSSFIILSSSWWLFQTRQATISAELLFWLSLSVAATWKLYDSSRLSWWLLWCLSLIGLAYMPGGILLSSLIIAVMLWDKRFKKTLSHIPTSHKSIGIFIYILALTPIIIASFNKPDYLQTLLNINDHLTIRLFFTSLYENLASAFIQLPNISPTTGINGMLIIRYSQAILVIFGLLVIIKKDILGKTSAHRQFRRFLATLLITGWFIGSLNDNPASSSYVIIPITLVMSAGLWYLLNTWNERFPVNPYARTIGLISIAIFVATTVYSNNNIYFKVWPSSPVTVRSYDSSLVNLRSRLLLATSEKCYVFYSPSEVIDIQLTPSLFGVLNRSNICQPSANNYADNYQSTTLVTSSQAWSHKSIDRAILDALSSRPKFPINSSLRSNSLQFWVAPVNK